MPHTSDGFSTPQDHPRRRVLSRTALSYFLSLILEFQARLRTAALPPGLGALELAPEVAMPLGGFFPFETPVDALYAPGGFSRYDLVSLQGALTPDSDHLLRINASPLLPLSPSQFLLLLVLLCHGRTLHGYRTPRKVSGPPWLTADRLLTEIERWGFENTQVNAMFPSTESSRVVRVVNELRDWFDQIGVSRELISTGRYHAGYRIETSPQNTHLFLPVPPVAGPSPRPGARPA